LLNLGSWLNFQLFKELTILYCEFILPLLVSRCKCCDRVGDEDQPNTKLNHANDPLEVPIGPITRARMKKLKEALNGLVQKIWSKMDLEGFETFKEHEGQPLIHLIHVQEEPNLCGTRGWWVRPNTGLVRLVCFPNATRIESQ